MLGVRLPPRYVPELVLVTIMTFLKSACPVEITILVLR